MQETPIAGDFLMELRKGSPGAFEELYRRYYRMVEDMVHKHGGSKEDTRDIFQEALFVFVKKLREPDFALTSKPSTFLYAISRNLYLKKARKASPEISVDQQVFHFSELTDPVTEGMAQAEQASLLSLLNEKLERLETDCRTLINYAFYQCLSHAQIAGLMGYTEAFVKVKKFRCLDYLRKMVKGAHKSKH